MKEWSKSTIALYHVSTPFSSYAPDILSKYFSSNLRFAYNRFPFLTTYGHLGRFNSSRTVFSPHPVYAIISETLKSAFSHIFIRSINQNHLSYLSKGKSVPVYKTNSSFLEK